MVGHPVVTEIIGANLLRSITGADLAAAFLGDRFLLFRTPSRKARSEHAHRLRPVLDLRLFVLLRHDSAGREVRDAYGR